MNKAQILAPKPPKSEPVEVPEWGGTVNVVCMSAIERDGMDVELFNMPDGEGMTNFRARVLVRAVRDENGARIFEDTDAEALGQQPNDVILRLYAVAKRLNGLNTSEIVEKK